MAAFLFGLDQHVLGIAVGAADQLDQVVARDGVAGLSVEDVVEAGLRAALVAQALEEEQRVGDPPAGVGVDPDEPLVPGRHLVGVAVPFQEPLLEDVGPLDERNLEVQAGRDHRIADRLAELRQDDLLGLADGVDRLPEHHEDREGDDRRECCFCSLSTSSRRRRVGNP